MVFLCSEDECTLYRTASECAVRLGTMDYANRAVNYVTRLFISRKRNLRKAPHKSPYGGSLANREMFIVFIDVMEIDQMSGKLGRRLI